MKCVVLAAIVALAPAACVSTERVTDSGKAVPRVTAEFPERSTAGTTRTAVFRVTNPGPADMESLVVTFARAGDPRLPEPIVDAGTRGRNPAVVSVAPEPAGVSSDGVVYRFQELEAGDSIEITFRLVVPVESGLAANAVQVYDGSDIERAAGIRLETIVER